MSIVGSRVPNKNLQKTRTHTHIEQPKKRKRKKKRKERKKGKKTLGNVKTRVIPVGLTCRPRSI